MGVPNMLDDYSYGMGYDSGYQDGRRAGYEQGWDEATKEYEKRIAALTAEIRTLEARVNVLSRKI